MGIPVIGPVDLPHSGKSCPARQWTPDRKSLSTYSTKRRGHVRRKKVSCRLGSFVIKHYKCASQIFVTDDRRRNYQLRQVWVECFSWMGRQLLASRVELFATLSIFTKRLPVCLFTAQVVNHLKFECFFHLSLSLAFPTWIFAELILSTTFIMPQSTSQQQGTSNSTTSSTQSKSTKPMSQYAMVKAAGFRNFHEFLLSYNLRVWNPEDVEEGKAILRALFEQDSD